MEVDIPQNLQSATGDPGELMCNSSTEVERLETQKEPMFHFESQD